MKSLSVTILLILSVFCPPVTAYDNPIYIWQRVWKPELLESVNRIKPISGHFMVLVGDVNTDNKRLTYSKVPVNWQYLKDAGTVTIDIRMRTGLAKNLTKKDISLITESITQFIKDIIHEAKIEGVTVQGIQIDYDCPTSQLADFTRLMNELRKKFNTLSVSITVLPTWMTSKDFYPLISSVDYYVLQLHSFEIPKENDKRQYIFPKDKAFGYFQQALVFHKPFYLSLPTYGYEVAYNKNGKFIGLRAEGGVQFYGEGIQRKMMYTDPKEIVDFLTSIEKTNSDSFWGVCWFRLPITTDRYNWDIITLERVIRKELPKGQLTLEINTTSSGVKELYMKNDGEMNYSEKVSFDIYWNGAKPIYDVLGDYEYSDLVNSKGIHVRGKAPRVSQRKMVAWFRSSNKNILTISTSGVIVNE